PGERQHDRRRDQRRSAPLLIEGDDDGAGRIEPRVRRDAAPRQRQPARRARRQPGGQPGVPAPRKRRGRLPRARRNCRRCDAHAKDDVDTELAKRHFAKGSQFYERAEYENALDEFLAALLAKPLPAFYFNIGKCYDRLENLDEAVKAYQTYLEAGPEPRDVP